MKRTIYLSCTAILLLVWASLSIHSDVFAKMKSTRIDFSSIGNMTEQRYFHTATLLQDGTVLIAGGFGQNSGGIGSATAETYHPVSRTFERIGDMTEERYSHVATLLSTGEVLITGSYTSTISQTAELYNPTNKTFKATDSMRVGRTYHTATALLNGKVLIAGGFDQIESLSEVELYDSNTSTFTTTGDLSGSRLYHTATLLKNGKVLITGGDTGKDGIYQTLTSAELYDPATGIFSQTGSMNVPHSQHVATLLLDGKVLITGGYSSPANQAEASAELYDPTTGHFTLAGNMTTRRAFHTGTRLLDGRVVLVGGYNQDGPIALVEIYDPASGTFESFGLLTINRSFPATTLLTNGQLLVTGGSNWIGATPKYLASAELGQPMFRTFLPITQHDVSISCPLDFCHAFE